MNSSIFLKKINEIRKRKIEEDKDPRYEFYNMIKNIIENGFIDEFEAIKISKRDPNKIFIVKYIKCNIRIDFIEHILDVILEKYNLYIKYSYEHYNKKFLKIKLYIYPFISNSSTWKFSIKKTQKENDDLY